MSDLEASDLKEELHDLYIVGAKKVVVDASGKTAVVVMVPYRFLAGFRRIHARLIRELEKKFVNNQFVLVARRRIQQKPKSMKVHRSRARTLTHVHEAMLEDVCYPVEIVGKRTRGAIDGSMHMRVFLDEKEKNNCENRLDTFQAVYKMLTGKECAFEFPVVTP